jgi:hypothetical protein
MFHAGPSTAQGDTMLYPRGEQSSFSERYCMHSSRHILQAQYLKHSHDPRPFKLNRASCTAGLGDHIHIAQPHANKKGEHQISLPHNGPATIVQWPLAGAINSIYQRSIAPQGHAITSFQVTLVMYKGGCEEVSQLSSCTHTAPIDKKSLPKPVDRQSHRFVSIRYVSFTQLMVPSASGHTWR